MLELLDIDFTMFFAGASEVSPAECKAMAEAEKKSEKVRVFDQTNQGIPL